MKEFKELTLEETKEWHVTLWTEVVKRLQQGEIWTVHTKRSVISDLNMPKIQYDCSLCAWHIGNSVNEGKSCDTCPLKVQYPTEDSDLTDCGKPWEGLVKSLHKNYENREEDIANAILIRDLDLSNMKPKNH